ncbi:LTA synthase family protein [Nitrospira sp. M1]
MPNSLSPLIQDIQASIKQRAMQCNARSPLITLALRHGLFLLITLFAFRLEKILYIQLNLGIKEWAITFLPEVGTVLLVEVFLFTLAFIFQSLGERTHRIIFHSSHALLYVIAIVEHQFLMKTGTQIDISLISYTTQHAGELSSVIRSGVDAGLLTRIVIAISCFLLGWQFTGKPCIRSHVQSALVVMAIIISPYLIGLSQPPGGTGTPFSTRIFVDFFFPLFTQQIAQAETLALPQAIYETPQLLDQQPTRRPNILLFVMESSRADVFPSYAHGKDKAQTPFFTQLAQQGHLFENVYTTVPHTSKALTGILCGMYPQLKQSISESESTAFPLRCLPHLLQELGYRTTFLQTAKGEFENRPKLLKNVGFDSWQLQEDLSAGYQEVGYFGLDELAMIEPTVDWIASNNIQPFFLTLLTVSTHHPYQIPGMKEWPEPNKEFSSYLEAIAYQDRFASQLYKQLQDKELLANTMLIFVGDHGEAFGEHYRKQHDVVPYEEGIRVPLLIYGPQWLGPIGTRGGLRHHIDLMPTILELLGVHIQGKLPGKSLFTTEGHEYVVSSCWYTNYCLALRQANWKFIYHFGRRTPEVFDLKNDPYETVNRINDVPEDLEGQAWHKMLQFKASVDEYYKTFTRI